MKTDDFYYYLTGQEGNTVRDQMDIGYNSGGHNQHENEIQLEITYQCRLKCEGSKTYHKPGYCPDCNMKLASVGRNYKHI